MSTHQRCLIAVLDRYGDLIEWRTVYDPPLVSLFPDQAQAVRIENDGRVGYRLDGVVIIDYRRRANGPQGRFKRPTENEIMQGITWRDRQFVPYYWGSAVKRGVIPAFTADFLKLEKVEQAPYGARYLLCNAWHGAAVTDGTAPLRVKILPEGSFVPGAGWVADGYGFISPRLAAKFNRNKPIELDRTRPSPQLAQWLNTENGAWGEIQDLVATRFESMTDSDYRAVAVMRQAGMLTQERGELVDINDEMALHPFIVDLPAETFADAWARLSMSVPFKAYTRLAVPVPGQRLVVPGASGKYGWVRFPLDGPTIQAEEIERRPELEPFINLPIVQHTMAVETNFGRAFAKGLSGVAEIGEYDAIICDQDIKIADIGVEAFRAVDEFEVTTGGFYFLSRYTEGSAAGLDPEAFKVHQGGDFDGDMISVFQLDQQPAIFQQIVDMDIGFETVKITKTCTKLHHGDMLTRAELIRNNMLNLVGIGANMLEDDLSIGDLELVAQKLGYQSAQSMLYAHNRAVKYGTDGFKSFLDIERVVKQVKADQSQFAASFGGRPPFQKWRRGKWAFILGIPKIGYDENWSDEDKEYCLSDQFQGTLAKIARVTLPLIEVAYRDLIEIKPLSYFRDMVPKPTHEYSRAAQELQHIFNSAVKRPKHDLDGEDQGGWVALKQESQIYAREYVEREGLDTGLMARALWYYAHDRKSGRAASVFFMFPEECRAILAEGMPETGSLRVTLTGLNYQFEQAPDRLDCSVDIADHPVSKGGKLIVRSVVCGNVTGQKPAKPPYPSNMLGLVSTNSQQPPAGRYRMTLVRSGASSWDAVLKPA